MAAEGGGGSLKTLRQFLIRKPENRLNLHSHFSSKKKTSLCRRGPRDTSFSLAQKRSGRARGVCLCLLTQRTRAVRAAGAGGRQGDGDTLRQRAQSRRLGSAAGFVFRTEGLRRRIPRAVWSWRHREIILCSSGRLWKAQVSRRVINSL